MRKLIATIALVLSTSAFANNTTPLGTSTDVLTIKQASTCIKLGEHKEQCDLKSTTWKIKPLSHHVIIAANGNSLILEAMMFKRGQFEVITKALTTEWGNGNEDVTKTSLSWKQNNWSYTLSKNPNGESALIGVKN